MKIIKSKNITYQHIINDFLFGCVWSDKILCKYIPFWRNVGEMTWEAIFIYHDLSPIELNEFYYELKKYEENINNPPTR